MNSYNIESVGKRIKSIRQNNGMNLEEFGNIFGVSKSNVSKWENGRQRPNNQRLKEIAEKGGCSISYLLFGTYDELISDMINLYFKNHSSLDFIDKEEIIQFHISKYNYKKAQIFHEISTEYTNSNNELTVSTWELKNMTDQVLYDEIAGGLKTYLNRLDYIYSSDEGSYDLKKFKNLSEILQIQFKKSEATLPIYLNDKVDQLYNDENLKYDEKVHEILKKDMIEFFNALLNGHFKHNMYKMTKNTINYISDIMIEEFEGINYKLNFNKFNGWNDLDDETKEKIFNQIDEMASLLIERELRN
ncbi:helix-turn-helix transcriptional regulator [Mammaliicoccus sp. G-M28]|uniref:helix-turn-helix domain-containing protein n=1 Tax=Mammaliicoccus sp. G-M28 TaxID=2898688 RepID=UPI001EFAAC8D|nr:helix-turn-helix transcriptional regulator [Mammaliicoccus sp. G-M28]